MSWIIDADRATTERALRVRDVVQFDEHQLFCK
jgi:hypothetical protein